MNEILEKRRRPAEWVLYSRRDCPLCDEMKHAIEASGLARGQELRVVDVDGESELAERFGLRVPVLEIGGKVAFEGRLTRAELAAFLEAR